MSLTKVTYTDNVTVIGADNLNDIQDAVLENETNISAKLDSTDVSDASTTYSYVTS